MLKTRIITALCLIPALIGIYFSLGLHLLTLVICVLSFWEWSKIAGLSGKKRVIYLVISSILLFVIEAILTDLWFGLFRNRNEWFLNIPLIFLLIMIIWWISTLVFVIKFPISFHKIFLLLVGFVIIFGCYFSLSLLHDYGLLLTVTHLIKYQFFSNAIDAGDIFIFVLITLVSSADIGAYFAGRMFGKHKLAPLVSPGKTIEGVVGGMISSIVVALIWLFFTFAEYVTYFNVGLVVLAASFIALASVLGDLTISMFKRHAGVKDSGNLLPGHGGVLDRIDGFTCAAPCAVLVMICPVVLYFLTN